MRSVDLLYFEDVNTKFVAQTSDLRWISLTLKKGVVGVPPLPGALVDKTRSTVDLLLTQQYVVGVVFLYYTFSIGFCTFGSSIGNWCIREFSFVDGRPPHAPRPDKANAKGVQLFRKSFDTSELGLPTNKIVYMTIE